MQTKEIEKKIQIFNSIHEIVNAMKAFAGVNFRKCEERIHSLRTFEEELYKGLGILLYYFPHLELPKTTTKKRLIIAFGSDQGFCGAYNHKLAEDLSKRLDPKDIIIGIGKKLGDFLEEFNTKPFLLLKAPVSLEGIRESLEELYEKILNLLKSIGTMEIFLFFMSVIERETHIFFEKVLPLEREKIMIKPYIMNKPLLYLPPEKLLKKFLNEWLFISVYRAYLEALRSESYLRIKSMDLASENIKRKITELQIARHYQRQEEITTEIIEILVGSKL